VIKTFIDQLKLLQNEKMLVISSDSDSDSELENHIKRLKISLHKSIQTLAQQEKIVLTPESHLAICEIVFEQTKLWGADLEIFSAHGKRANVNHDDIKLLLRRHPTLMDADSA
jgi:hypothetical protein